MLGYRSYFTVKPVNDFTRTIDSHFTDWLRVKRKLQHDDLSPGRHLLDRDAVVEVTESTGRDQVQLRQIKLSEAGGWTTILTTEHSTQPIAQHTAPQAGQRESWVWLEVHSPDQQPWTGTPDLARRLVATLDGRDGVAALREKPLLVHGDDLDSVDEVVDAICDPDRRGLIFVAGSPDHAVLQWELWRQQVESLLAETVGIAASYHLDPAATQRLADEIGPTHAVAAASIRTYLPEADPSDPVDARRHRTLTTAKIAERRDHALRRGLGADARRQVVRQPLPSRLIRIQRRLTEQLDQQLVQQLSIAPPRPPRPHVPATATAPDELVGPVNLDAATEQDQAHEAATAPATTPATTPTPTPTPTPAPAQSLAERALHTLVTTILGRDHYDETALDEILLLAEQGRATQDTITRTSDRLRESAGQIADLQERVTQLQVEADDAQLDAASQLDDNTRLRDQVRYLQRRLVGDGRSDQAWAAVPEGDQTTNPENFTELWNRLPELPHIVVTADQSHATALDNREMLGRTAAKAWTALLALSDYAASRLSGQFRQGVHPYLRETPSGQRTYPAKSHAPGESSRVHDNTKYRTERIFPVPTTIDADGKTFMDAHFKLGAKGTISPRMYYLDCTDTDGTIYVGYIGRHLTNTKTN